MATEGDEASGATAPRPFSWAKPKEVRNVLVATLATAGYVAAGVVFGLLLKPAAEAFERFGRSSST
jgi:hypothetical protein